MARLKSYGYMTSHDLIVVAETGKLNIVDNITCPFCETRITETRTDARDVPMPFCSLCGVFLVPVWQITKDATGRHLTLGLSPKAVHATHTEIGEIKEASHTLTMPEENAVGSQSKTHTSKHKDVVGQVLAFMENLSPATTAEMLNALDCSRQSLNNALTKLVETQQIRKIKRGVYETAH